MGRPTITSFRPDELRRRRVLDLGLTQRAAAQHLGVSVWTYQRWETGHHTPRADRLSELAAFLGCDPDDLVDPPTTLADYRTLAGLTQADLAKRLEVTRVTVAQWEAGLMPIAAKHHELLAAELGISVEELPQK